MRLPLLLAALALAGCASTAEPRIVTQRVEVPVVAKCSADPGPPPQYADTPQAIKAAPDIFERAKLLLAGRDQRDGWIARLAAANAGCR